MTGNAHMATALSKAEFDAIEHWTHGSLRQDGTFDLGAIAPPAYKGMQDYDERRAETIRLLHAWALAEHSYSKAVLFGDGTTSQTYDVVRTRNALPRDWWEEV